MDNSEKMKQYTQPLSLRHHDIAPLFWEKLSYVGPCRSCPTLRDYYMLHYVLSGRATSWINGRPFPLEAGQCIVYHPNDLVEEEAEDGASATFLRLAITGFQSRLYFSMMGITRENPVFPWKGNQIMEENIETILSLGSSTEALTVHTSEQMVLRLKRQNALNLILMECLQNPSVLLPPVSPKMDYVEKAIIYMEEHCFAHITIADIAKNIGLSRSHLFTHFKKITNRSPQEYLSMIRVQKACEFFRNPSVTVTDVASSLGYDDPHSFSRLFKQIMQVTPSEYRRQISQNRSERNG